jgi:hypothetical protein
MTRVVTSGGDALEEGVVLLSECGAVSVECGRSAQDVIRGIGTWWISAAEYGRSVIREIEFSRISGLICKGVACDLAKAWLKFDVVNSEKPPLFPAKSWLGISALAEKLPCSAEYPSWRIF